MDNDEAEALTPVEALEYRGRQYNLSRYDNTEDKEEYRPGGFHPVHLGDSLGEGSCYRVLHKLGNGGGATVWLCHDLTTKTYVAVKILMADLSRDDCPELKLMNRKVDFSQEGGEYIRLPYDSFWIEGPNGRHLCLILPVLGPRLDVIWHSGEDKSQVAREISCKLQRAMLSSQAWHLSWWPSNILLRIKDFDAPSEGEMLKMLGEPRLDPVVLLDGGDFGPSAPEYLAEPIDFECLKAYTTPQACIADFGESYDVSSPPQGIGLPSLYCSPELMFDNHVGLSCDIWALACTIYELRSVTSLFEPWDGGDTEVIMQVVKLLGKLPEPWWSSWKDRKIWFEEDGTIRRDEKTGKPKSAPNTIETLLEEGKHYRIGGKDGMRVDILVPPEEAAVLADMLLPILAYDWKSRPSVEDVLKHPWFKL